MFEFMRNHQLNIMLGLSSICFVVGFFALITKALPKRRKLSLADLEFSACILLFSDRLAYMYHGDVSVTGFFMVRISNFLVFFMTICVVHAYNIYLSDLSINEIALPKVPVRLKIVEAICGIGWFMVIISQFIGLYYTFDENNAYQRGPGFIICYAIPFIALFIQLSVILQYIRRMSLYISIPLLLFSVMPMVASVIQALNYGVSLTNMTIVGLGVVLYIFAIIEMNELLDKAQKEELNEANEKNLSLRRSFEQIVSSLVNAADSRDKFTSGHSTRVADYSKKIAMAMGMDERQCFRVYYSAMLHDIGKIKIPDTILGNRERLTDEEKETFNGHAVIGKDILSGVEELPYIKDAAQYHHERYDGKGYPEGKKGEEIPLIARIVAVANAYDEMTSYKYSRGPLAQGKVRETMIQGAGTAFDPKIVDIMVDMIDKDSEYMMRETDEEVVDEADKNDITIVNRMHFDNYKDQVSDGLLLSKEYLKIRFEEKTDEGHDAKKSMPAVILFDSFDRCVHRNERNIKNLHYFEYGEIWFDGHSICTAARDIKTLINEKNTSSSKQDTEWRSYEIEAVCIKDHVKLKISDNLRSIDATIALPDATRAVLLGITGEHCTIRNISVTKISLSSGEDPIDRIAPEVNYFVRKDGDVPNIEICDYREEASMGIPVIDAMRLMFHTQSLPIANLVHHCAYIVLYSSDDGIYRGKNYVEYSCIRMDGDEATENGKAECKFKIHRSDDFAGWDEWKEKNKRGLDYVVEFKRKRNRIRYLTGNAGIDIDCLTVIPPDVNNVYVAITGNLCAITDIRVR